MTLHAMIRIWVCAPLLACAARQLDEETGPTGDVGEGPGGETVGVPTTSSTGIMGTGGGSVPSETASSSASAETSSTVTTGAETTVDDTCGFICDRDTGATSIKCDAFNQECPAGEKCAVYADERGADWNATRCVPVTGNGQPGDPCVTPQAGSGLDDCAEGMVCWDLDAMDHGTCFAMCTGSEAMPLCAADGICAVTSSSILNVCIPPCDPLAQDCLGDDSCVSVADTFICTLDVSGDEGQVFDSCEFFNACDKGLLCLSPDAASECDANASGCCLPMCDLDDPGFVCPGVGQVCVSLYEEGQAPEEFANIGSCSLPP